MFTVLRHPVHRLHSLFFYLRMNRPWEKHGKARTDLKNMRFIGEQAANLPVSIQKKKKEYLVPTKNKHPCPC